MNAILIAIDTETGGAGETQCMTHALLSVGMYAELPDGAGGVREFSFHQLIIPEMGLRVDDEARRVNGFTLTKWRDGGAVNESVAMMRALNWISMVYAFGGVEAPQKLQMVAHNAGHDRGFFHAALERHRMLPTVLELVSRRWECSCAALGFWRRATATPGECSLDALTALRTKSTVEAVKAARGVHTADADALECYRGYQWMLAQM